MGTFYAMIDGEITEIRVLITEVQGDRWEGHPCAKTPTELMKVCGAIVINRGA